MYVLSKYYVFAYVLSKYYVFTYETTLQITFATLHLSGLFYF